MWRLGRIVVPILAGALSACEPAALTVESEAGEPLAAFRVEVTVTAQREAPVRACVVRWSAEATQGEVEVGYRVGMEMPDEPRFLEVASGTFRGRFIAEWDHESASSDAVRWVVTAERFRAEGAAEIRCDG